MKPFIKHIRVGSHLLGTIGATEKSIAVALPSKREPIISRLRGRFIVLGRLRKLDETGGGVNIPAPRERKIRVPKSARITNPEHKRKGPDYLGLVDLSKASLILSKSAISRIIAYEVGLIEDRRRRAQGKPQPLLAPVPDFGGTSFGAYSEAGYEGTWR